MFVPVAPHHSRAILLMVLASAFIAGTTLLAKLLGAAALGPALHPLQISHGRFLFAALAVAAVVGVVRPKLARPHWRLHAGRTALGWGGVTLMFASVAHIPLGDATAISFLNPVFAMILSVPLLSERVGPVRWLAACVALLGALILLRPGFGSFRPEALLALAAALIFGVELILIKKLSGREAPLQILLVNNFLGLCISSVAVAPVWAMPSPAQWAALAGIGVLMAAAQACFVNAMARADASFVTPFSYLTLVFATLYDGALLGHWPDWVSALGAGVILAGAGLLAWRQGRLRHVA